MNKNKKKKLTTSLAVALAALLLIGGGTFAYLQSNTEDVVNTFNANQVTVELTETTGGDYNIIPGTTQEKDPKVTVDNSIDAYVYVEVTDTTDGLVTYSIAEGWTLLDGYDDVYYREITASESEQSFNVLAGDQVTYSADLENEDMLDGDTLKKDLNLTFKAYAIQKEPFDDAVAAWNQVPAEVSTVTEINSAIDEGKPVVLTEDITSEDTLAISNESADIDLGGHTLDAPVSIGNYGTETQNVEIKNGKITGNRPAFDGLVDIYTNGDNYPLDVVLEDVIVTPDEAYVGDAVYAYGWGTKATFNNCNVTGKICLTDSYGEFNGGTYMARENDECCIYINVGATINDGNFTSINENQKLFKMDKSSSKEYKFTINGGVFSYEAKYAIYVGNSSPAGFVVINGGTFNAEAYTPDMYDKVAVKQ